MNLKTVVPLSAAGVLGLVAAIVAAQLVKQRPVIIQEGEQSRTLNLVDAVVASRDLAPGTILNVADLSTTRFEGSGTPPNSFKVPLELINRVLKQQVPRGQVFHPSMLAESGVAGGLAAVIPEGMRAVTVEVNEFTGIAGLVEPGNRVDVMCRLKDDVEKGTVTRTVCQDVQVIAIGQVLTNSKAVSEQTPNAAAKADAESTLPASKQASARSVTLLLKPEDAERIDLAMGENPTMALRLALRSPTDRKQVETGGATMAALLGNDTGDAGGTGRLAAAKLPGAGVGATTRPAGTTPADDAFGPGFRPEKPAGRMVTVIRAGVASQVEVDEAQPAEATAVAQ